MPWIRRSWRVVTADTLAAALGITALVLAAILVGQFYPRKTRVTTIVTINNGAAPNTSLAAVCDDGRVINTEACARPCRSAYFVPSLNACLNTLAPGGTPCTNACYRADANTTTCDATGACVGSDVTECRGHCSTDADCATAIPLNPFWLTLNATDNERIFLNYRHVCYLNKCELFTLDRYWQTQTGNFGMPVAGYNRCDDYLLPSFVQERRQCLTMSRYLLSPNLTNPNFYPPGITATTSQFSMCLFYHDCAPINQTAIVKRSSSSSSTETYSEYARVSAMKKHLYR